MEKEAAALRYTFHGLDGFAGFRNGQTYEVEVTKEDDGSGEVQVSMPYALGAGSARFTAQQWREWWNKK